ncbi:MAG: tetratricopeptide repeat protein [Flavobacteriaceae bacterium]
MKYPWLYLFLCVQTVALAQSKVDSLSQALLSAKEDSTKIDLLFELFFEHEYNDTLSSQQYLKESMRLATQSGDTKRLAKAQNYMGDLLLRMVHNDSAIYYYEKGFELSQQAHFPIGMITATIGIGNGYWQKGNYEKALAYQNKNIQLAQKYQDSLGLASSYNNIGNIYNEQGEFSKAMEYYIQSSNIYKKMGSLRNYGITLSNIGQVNFDLDNNELGIAYFKQSDSIFALSQFEDGQAYVQKSLAIALKRLGKYEESIAYNTSAFEYYKTMGNKRRMSEIEEVLGNTYLELKNKEVALSHYLKAVEFAEASEDSMAIATSRMKLGYLYLELKDLPKAKLHLEQSLALSQRVGVPLTTMDAYEALSRLYEQQNNFPKALESYRSYSELRDSLYTTEKRDLALEIEAKYQNKQKGEQIKLLETENSLNALQLQKRINERNGIIAFAILFLLIAGLLYAFYISKQKANGKLKELDQLKSHFFANISHEFRTPLTLIKGPIEKFENNPSEGLSLENAQMIHRNANRLLQLVNQLLELSKIDAGTLKLEPVEGDLFGHLRHIAFSFNALAVRNHIDYQVTIPKKNLWASFDKEKLENIVYNILSNAFKFTDKGGWIGCAVSLHEGQLRIQVEDSGCGIPPKDLPHIFERFYQVDSTQTRTQQGSGIGLSLCKDLVALLGGTITVTSTLQQGTTFTINLPITTVPEPKATVEEFPKVSATPTLEAPQVTPADQRNLPQILLVEDHDDMRQFVAEILLPSFRILSAQNGAIGIEMAHHYSPDLIITDLMMPTLDGMELCKSLKTNVHTSHIPIIMLTAKAGMENKIEGLETGADDYLIKPFEPEELLVRSKNLIAQRAQLRLAYQSKASGIDPKEITVNSLDAQFMEKLLELLEGHYEDATFGVPQMQDVLAMSKTQLYRKVKALTNETPGELLRNFRLKRAAQLLAQDSDSVTQIAYQVGFNNLSYFAKCFREYFGVSPSSYSTDSQ